MELTSINPAAYSHSSTSAVSPQEAAQRRELRQAAKTVNSSGTLGENQLVISVDRATHRTIIRVVNRDTREVVLQLPPDYVLRLARDLGTTSSHIAASLDDV